MIDEVQALNNFESLKRLTRGKYAYFPNALICNFETYWARYSLPVVFKYEGISTKIYLCSVLRNNAL